MTIVRDGNRILMDVSEEWETDRVGRAIASVMVPNTTIGLVGPLGAGKTRLSRAIAEGLGVDPGAISSPTYVLIQEYEGDLPIAHFDSYRLEGPEAFDALGPGDYWEAGGLCLVEWADRVADRLPRDAWWITIEIDDPLRRLTIEIPEPAVRERLFQALSLLGG